jgi:hypothetical protein
MGICFMSNGQRGYIRVLTCIYRTANSQQQNAYPPAPAIDHIKEQEFWNAVVERTEQYVYLCSCIVITTWRLSNSLSVSRQLIDISSAQTDLLQNQDAQERSEKYQ